jgi:LEA14-like dessication related protein
MVLHLSFIIQYSSLAIRHLALGVLFLAAFTSCKPKEEVVFRQVRNIVVEADNNEPMLHAQAVLYNPNKMRMKLRKINVEVFVDGKNAAKVDQKLKTEIPAEAEFTVPLEVKLNIKELGLLDTILGVIGGKKYKIQFKGSISITYKGLPIKVPVDYKTEARLKF